MNNALEESSSALEDLMAMHEFIPAHLLADAIKIVKLAVSAPEGSAARQEHLDQVYPCIDNMLLRDFSGEVTTDPNDLVLICRNAFELYDMAVEHYNQSGHASFYYLPAEKALKFLQTALINIDKQVANLKTNENAADQNDLNTRKYKSIRKKVVEAFNSEVVEMLGDVAGHDFSLEAADSDGNVFADKITDAMFFAWSLNYKMAPIAKGCIYDYLASGDRILLSGKRSSHP